MFFSSLVAVVLALSTSAIASPVTSFKDSVVEKLNGPPVGWVKDESAKLDKDADTITLRFHLVQQDLDKWQEMAMNIATPGHELYGKHLAQHVIDKIIAPKDESRDLVMQWLDTEGLSSHASVSSRGDSVVLTASIKQIEKLLKAEYITFLRTESRDIAVRTLEYSLPVVFQDHVDMVQPTTFFGLRTMKSTVSNPRPFTETNSKISGVEAVEAVTGCTGSTITPKCLANLYSFTGATAYTAGRMGIAGFLKQWPSKTDLTTYMNSYQTQGNAAQTYTCALINGGTCPSSGSGYPGVEANLDVQYARAITENIPNVYYSTGGSPPIVGSGANTNEPYLEFLNYLLALPAASLPNTLSISYGEDEATVPLAYADQTCILFSQLGARGVSITVSSGDSGVGTTCKLNGATQFTTSFPASCPWVTTVGGTTGNSPESAWSGGGGGFSSRFGVPSYQAATVSKWLTTDTTHTAVSKYFNASGRAYPDVSAQATDFTIVVSGRAQLVDGTSCSSPTFASIIQLINSDRISKGKAGLGFLNPWLYSTAASTFTDISSGKISGCSGVISGAGFSAVAGWDPATGLGTPNFAKLLVASNAT